MKKKELGITGGEVVADLRGGCCAIYLKERVSDTNGCHFEDKRNIFYSSKGAKFNGSHLSMDEETQNNFALIADAFNTSNKCGLLPSELLEQRDELLELLKMSINAVGSYAANSKPAMNTYIKIKNTIDQIEQ